MDLTTPIPPGGKVIQFGKPAPLVAHDGEHWHSALDCLRELVSDIETGRVETPTMIYVAMQTSHPEKPQYKKYPSYCWSDCATSGIAMLGLLTKHINKVCNP